MTNRQKFLWPSTMGIFAALVIFVRLVYAQGASNPQLITFYGTPTGVCDVYQVALNVSNGSFYACNRPGGPAGTWISAGSALLSSNNTLTGSNTITQPLISTVATGTAPFSITSTTVVPNLNAQLHGGLGAPASAIVGISDSQSLTNKALTGALSGNTVTLLSAQANLGAFTGSSSAQTFYATSVGANTVANLKGVRFCNSWTHSSGSASIAYTATFNGQALPGTGSSAAANGSYCVTILNTGSTSGTANAMLTGAGAMIASAPAILSGLSWASIQTLQMNFNVAPSDQITPIQLTLELLQ